MGRRRRHRIHDLTSGDEILSVRSCQLITDLDGIDDLHGAHLMDIGSDGRIHGRHRRRCRRRAAARRAGHALRRCRHPAIPRCRVDMPRIALARVVVARCIAVKCVASEEIRPRRRLIVDARTELMRIIERRHERCRDVRKVVDISLVLHDRILQRL